MATFTALNIEYDQATDTNEVDDTKELQVEEALKLYQTALKYHSEGPSSYEQAAEAYAALFRSEIFQYPESQSELRRIELYGPAADWEDLEFVEAGPLQLVTTTENAPNTLPQILHLSFKNNGVFFLDKLQHDLQRKHVHTEGIRDRGYATVKTALRLFAEALDKDDTDLELWGSSAGVASLIGSERIARYCLEAILDDEDEGFKGVLALPGIEESFAIHELKNEVMQMQDDLAVKLAPLSRLQKKTLSRTILQRLNPYKRIGFPGSETLTLARPGPHVHGDRHLLRPAARTWTAVGDALLRQYETEQSGCALSPGSALVIHVPPPEPSAAYSMICDGGPHEEPKEPTHVEPRTEQTDLKQVEAEATGSAPNVDGAPGDKAVGTGEDVQMTDSPAAADNPEVDHGTNEGATATEQNARKRSLDSAGLQDAEESVRLRSKRIRARETVVDKSTSKGSRKSSLQYAEDRLRPFAYADQELFTTVGGLLEKMGVTGYGSAEALKSIVQEDPVDSPAAGKFDLNLAIKDMHAIAETCNPEVVSVLLSPDITDELQNGAQDSGMNAFLSSSKAGGSKSNPAMRFPNDLGLDEWLANVNCQWLCTPEIASLWVERLLRQKTMDGGSSSEPSSYRQHLWSKDLKRVVVQLIVQLDERFFRNCTDDLSRLGAAILEANARGETYELLADDTALMEMIQTFFELHLDVYSLIKEPSSGVDMATRTMQSDRLERWALATHEALLMRAKIMGEDPLDELSVRHLWATSFHLAVSNDVPQEHVLLCMHQLKALLQTLDGTLIELQNNAKMPELSVAAIDAELNSISMKDFFSRVFDDSETDPVTTIESLEPILELPFAQCGRGAAATHYNGAESDSVRTTAVMEVEDMGSLAAMSRFLENGSIWPRLNLWKRLREAYEQIELTPKVVSCYMRCIDLLANELKVAAYRHAPRDQRHFMLFSWIKMIDDFLVKILAKTQTVNGTAVYFDCIDESILKSTLASLADVSKVFHTFYMYEDTVRVGNIQGPIFEGKPKPSFSNVAGKLHDMGMRVLMLQYQLLKEGMAQDPESFANPEEDRFNFLRATHYAVGVRAFCKGTNKAFLRMVKEELLAMSDLEGRDFELSQILHDLYGLKCCANVADLTDHGNVTNIDPLTRKTATKLLDFVMARAKAVPPKDLPKLELKITIDKVHEALGKTKASDDALSNRRTYNRYIGTAINPLELYRCLQGIRPVVSRRIPDEDAIPAAKGWYLLMGSVSLNKYLGLKQKSVQAPPVEDLNIAIQFFIQDLEYCMDHWETWYRLAQCYDLKLEELVLWSAEKMNDATQSYEISQNQRYAINCYTMAVANSCEIADMDAENTENVAKLYSDFGNRIYSSSRQPFSMRAFELRADETRFLSQLETSVGPKRTSAFVPLGKYTAWKYAAALFKRAIARAPDNWWTYYMLGKCLWKMYRADEPLRNQFRHPDKLNVAPSMDYVLDALTRSIETVPHKRDARKEPVLEPHYKLVSIVHKLVQLRHMEPSEGSEVCSVSKFLREIDIGPLDEDSWERYVLALLKLLRKTDKSGWHHRMTARAAHIHYGEADIESRKLGALAARHELMQQIFTKSMSVQVWKPEHERPGRHFVYTTRYTDFFVKLLTDLDDRSNMELLAKRVRRKPQDFFDHHGLWLNLCQAYLNLLRRLGKIPHGHEDAVFKSMSYEQFLPRAVRIENWAQEPDTKSPLLDVLRDVVELKRTNNGLMKPTLIDDLIGDCYAKVYNDIGPTLDAVRLPQHVLHQLGGGVAANFDGAVDGQAQDGPGRPRTKGVGRRELQRRAEAAVTLPVRAQMPVPVRPLGNQTVQVVIPSPDRGGASGAAATGTARSGRLGSADGSADEESELSELSELDDEDGVEQVEVGVERQTMFPGLRRRFSGAASESGGGTPEREEREGEGEGDEDAGGDGGADGDGDGDGDVVMKDE